MTIIVLWVFPTLIFAQGKSPIVKLHKRAYYDVFVEQDQSLINLTNFEAWENIESLSVSPDGQYCFFRHKANKSKSFKASIYDLKTLTRIAQITPGYGGSFIWNQNNQIIHAWGCGTNCSNLKVYNLQLEEIFFTLSNGGFEISPKGDIIVQLDMYGKQFWIYDLRKLDGGIAKGVNKQLPVTTDEKTTLYDLWSLTFTSDYQFNIAPKTAAVDTKAISYDIKTMTLKDINPLDTGTLYERNF